MVRKPHNQLEPFSRDALFLTVHKSCEHRPDAVSDASALTEIVVDRLLRTAQAEVAVEVIVAATAEVLGRFDATAKTVYTAYYAS